MTPQERAAAIVDKVKSELTPIWLGGRQRMLLEQEIAEALTATRRAAMLEVRQFCVDYEDCCVLGLVSHADKAVTNASISTTQFIKRHIDDRLAQEGT